MKLLHLPLIVAMLCTLDSTLCAQLAAATAFVPHTVIEEQQSKDAAGIICLYHSAAPDTLRRLLGQDFSVFRDPAVETAPVGKVRLTAAIGAHYLESVQLVGELKAGDVVQLGENYALVVLINGRCETLQQTDQAAEK